MIAAAAAEFVVSEPFLGEIRVLSFSFPPRGWALCNGQLLPINQNQALFSLLGTTYGGDGRVNFGLPDLRGRTPVHFGSGVVLGERAGDAAVALTTAQLPPHTHALVANADVASSTNPAANVPAKKPRFGADIYAAPAHPTVLAASSVGTTGASQPHENLQPYLVLSFVIALQGIFPSQN